ncbi:MAG: DMT family transporter [Halieaceae bacterium]|nr:DMT family transporter [Halieaceae bacterium]
MPQNRRALLLGLTAVLLWSTVATAFKLALRYLDVFQLLFYATLSSAAVLLLVLSLRRSLPELLLNLREAPGYFLGMALLNPCCYYLVLLSAYDRLPAQQAQAINYTWAITLSLLAIPVLKQPLKGRDLVAAGGGYLGVLVIATRGDIASLDFDSPAGVALALFSTLLWALYWLASARNHRDAAVSLCLMFMLAVPVTGLLCVVFSSLSAPGWQGLAAAVYVGFFEMGITFMLWAAALRTASRVALVGNLIFLSPFLSLVFIQWVLGEQVHPATLVGLVLIVPAALWQQMEQPAAA